MYEEAPGSPPGRRGAVVREEVRPRVLPSAVEPRLNKAREARQTCWSIEDGERGGRHGAAKEGGDNSGGARCHRVGRATRASETPPLVWGAGGVVAEQVEAKGGPSEKNTKDATCQRTVDSAPRERESDARSWPDQT